MIAWLPPHCTATIPHTTDLDHLLKQHPNLLSYDNATKTLTATCVIDEELYQRLLVAYATHPDVASITANLKQLKDKAKHHITDDELARLETWARRIRGEIFFARKWLIVEGQSDYLIMHSLATLMGYAPDEHGISIIDAQNNGSAGIFAALARALAIPWVALFDGDKAGQGYVDQIKNRDFDPTELAQRCHVIPAADIEELLVNNGLEQELRAILARLGVNDAPTIPTPDLITKLRAQKIEYAIELCNDLHAQPALLAKVPKALKDAITQLQAVQS